MKKRLCKAIALAVITAIAGWSCSSVEDGGEMTLVKTDSLSFQLDERTKNELFNYALYADKEKTYFSFQNQNTNELLFYNLATQDFEFKMTPPMDGSNGVGRVSGYYIHNMDSIYLTNLDIKEISLINKECSVLNKYLYDQDCEGKELSSFYLGGAHYKPAQQIGRTLYLYSGPNRFIEQDPVAITFDMDNGTIKALPFCYPDYPGSDIKLKKYGLEDSFSRCYDGKHFIYSFYYDENIYIATPSHDSIEKRPIKSKYFEKVQLPDELKATPQDFCLNAWYGNLLYDPYREVYYRIAYPSSESMDKGVRPVELFSYGRKNFSIIILDKDLNIIGETLFPDYTYNSWVLFVAKDGLYISSSHYLNPNFSDDLLSFHKFELFAQD